MKSNQKMTYYFLDHNLKNVSAANIVQISENLNINFLTWNNAVYNNYDRDFKFIRDNSR